MQNVTKKKSLFLINLNSYIITHWKKLIFYFFIIIFLLTSLVIIRETKIKNIKKESLIFFKGFNAFLNSDYNLAITNFNQIISNNKSNYAILAKFNKAAYFLINNNPKSAKEILVEIFKKKKNLIILKDIARYLVIKIQLSSYNGLENQELENNLNYFLKNKKNSFYYSVLLLEGEKFIIENKYKEAILNLNIILKNLNSNNPNYILANLLLKSLEYKKDFMKNEKRN